jgi:glycolate oxidase
MKSFSPRPLLKRRLGIRAVFTDNAALDAASFDSAKIPCRPEAVVHVRAESDVGVVLALANRHGVPVTTRGRGTTLTGAATPVRGGWVLDLLGLNKIAIDDEAGLARVGAGATVGDIQRAALAKGWFYPPDPFLRSIAPLVATSPATPAGCTGESTV